MLSLRSRSRSIDAERVLVTAIRCSQKVSQYVCLFSAFISHSVQPEHLFRETGFLFTTTIAHTPALQSCLHWLSVCVFIGSHFTPHQAAAQCSAAAILALVSRPPQFWQQCNVAFLTQTLGESVCIPVSHCLLPLSRVSHSTQWKCCCCCL